MPQSCPLPCRPSSSCLEWYRACRRRPCRRSFQWRRARRLRGWRVRWKAAWRFSSRRCRGLGAPAGTAPLPAGVVLAERLGLLQPEVHVVLGQGGRDEEDHRRQRNQDVWNLFMVHLPLRSLDEAKEGGGTWQVFQTWLLRFTAQTTGALRKPWHPCEGFFGRGCFASLRKPWHP